MNLYICGSNRKKNCYRILNDLKNNNDKLISLDEMNINYCAGCNSCTKNLKEYCVIKDDMQEIYKSLIEANKIIIASPVYMNFITGILKNMIDRLNPYSCHSEILKGKKVYLILIGQLDKEENEEISNNLKLYFESLAEFMEFEFQFLKYLSSGDVETIDDVVKNNENYNYIIKEIKKEINTL